MNGTYISCPSCGNLVEQGASCDECATWREDNDKELAALKAELNQAVYLSDKRAQERDRAEAERDVLKAEVETLRKEVGSKSAWATQMQKELQQERERSEKLAGALELSKTRFQYIKNTSYCIGAGLVHIDGNCKHCLATYGAEQAKQALLAAKRDEGEV